jgi:hypothetical protein
MANPMSGGKANAVEFMTKSRDELDHKGTAREGWEGVDG